MDIIVVLTIIAATISFALPPGPGTMAVMATSTSQGMKAALFVSLGEVTGDLMYLSMALLSLGILGTVLEPIMFYIRIIGAAYIIYIGVMQILHARIKFQKAVKKRSLLRYYLTGFVISGTNPKVIIFYLSFLPLFVDLTNLTIPVMFETAVIIAIAVLSCLVFWCVMGRLLDRLFLARPNFATWVNRITGGILVGVGVAVIRS